jgi:hypothetical protein
MDSQEITFWFVSFISTHDDEPLFHHILVLRIHFQLISITHPTQGDTPLVHPSSLPIISQISLLYDI